MTLLKNLETRSFNPVDFSVTETSLLISGEEYPFTAIEGVRFGYADIRMIMSINVFEIDAGPLLYKATLGEKDRAILLGMCKQLDGLLRVMSDDLIKKIQNGEMVRLGGRHGVRISKSGIAFKDKGRLRLKPKMFAFDDLRTREVELIGDRRTFGGNHLALYVSSRTSPSLLMPMMDHWNLALLPFLIAKASTNFQ